MTFLSAALKTKQPVFGDMMSHTSVEFTDTSEKHTASIIMVGK
jgi:hypothetical protein